MPSFRTKVQLDGREIDSIFVADTPEEAAAALLRYLKLEFVIPDETVIHIKTV